MVLTSFNLRSAVSLVVFKPSKLNSGVKVIVADLV